MVWKKKNKSGQRQSFVSANQKFYLQLKMTDPNNTTALINLPEGVRVRLMNNGNPVPGNGAVNKTDSNGKVYLAPNSDTIQNHPNYHFKIDLDERTYFDIDKNKLVPSKDIKESTKRNLMEIPMVIDTRTGGFFYDQTKLPLAENGMLNDYAQDATGLGNEEEPIVLEVRFYWYYLKFIYFDRIANKWQNVPRGIPIVPIVNGQNYLSRYIKDLPDFGADIHTETKKIQHYLNLLGFDCGNLDGTFNEKTLAALKNFRKTHNAESDVHDSLENIKKIEQVFCRRRVCVWKNGVYWVPVWRKKSDNFQNIYFEMASIPDNFRILPNTEDAYKEEVKLDLFLYTAKKSSNPKVMTRQEIYKKEEKHIYDKLPFPKAIHYYDLPVEWSSKNYWTRYNFFDPVGKTRYDETDEFGERYQTVIRDKLKLYPFDADESKRASVNSPMMFSFDDIVLTANDDTRSQNIRDKDETDTAKDLDEHSRYTGFFIDDSEDPDEYRESPETYEKITGYKHNKGRIKIYRQDQDKPFFSKDKFLKETIEGAEKYSNLIHNVSGNTRIVYFSNDFYDVYNKRSRIKKTYNSTYTFDPDKDILGARLAVKNDPDVHKNRGPIISTSVADKPSYGVNKSFHYELHYFHNCFVYKNKPLSYLFIYWSCRLTNDGVTDQDVTNHRQSGMTNAMARLNKDYMIETNNENEQNKSNNDKVDIYIRPFHFIEAKDDSNGGKQKTKIRIVTHASGSALTWIQVGVDPAGKFRDDCFRAEPNAHSNDFSGGTPADTDGIIYTPLANHHEMGHATGNYDDYLYSYEWLNRTWRGAPKYDQGATANGGPYNCDKLSRMFHNRTPRLRDFWKYVCWLHDEGNPADTTIAPNIPEGLLYKFHKRTRFKITHEGKKGRKKFTHNFELADAYKNVASPSHIQIDHLLSSTYPAKTDLLLYKLGDDELSHFPNLGNLERAYNKKQTFKGILIVKTKIAIKFDGGGWGANDCRNWARTLNGDIKEMLNGKFQLRCGNKKNDFSVIYVYFVPHYVAYAGVNPVPAGSHFNLKVSWDEHDPAAFTTVGMSIEADKNVNKNRIIRYLFGKTTETGDLTKTDFSPIVKWVGQTVAGGNENAFSMSNL